MKGVYCNKSLFLSLLIILLGLVFVYFLFSNPTSSQTGTDWILSFCRMLIFYYLLFVISSCIQIIFVLTFRIFPLKVFSIYPFTYDGKWRFHPIKLIYNIEGFSNSLILNLSKLINDPEKLSVTMKKLLIVRKISLFISILFMFLFVQHFNTKTAFMFFIVYIGIILCSYFKYDDFWIGYDYLYLEGTDKIIYFLLSSKTIMLINSMNYAKGYVDYQENSMIEELSILENYLYRCILEKQTIIPADVLKDHLKIYRNPEKVLLFNLKVDTKWLNILKLIGIVGLECDNHEYIDCSIEELTNVYINIINNSIPFFIEHGTNLLKLEIDSIKLFKEGYNNNVIKLQNLQNIFSSYENLFA